MKRYEYLGPDQSRVVADMLNYARVLNGKTQLEIISDTGISPNVYNQLESNVYKGVRLSFLPFVEGYFGVGHDDLLTCIEKVAEEMRLFRTQLSGGLIDSSRKRTLKINNTLYVAREFSFDPQSRYRSKPDSRGANIVEVETKDLPFLKINLSFVDHLQLLADGMMPVVERLVRAPFAAYYDKVRQHKF